MVPTAPLVTPLRTTPLNAALEMLREETLGEYEIQAELGRGGMATVYLAHDIALGRPVAIKVMSPALVEEGVAERFRREARTAALLTHPHIIPIYAVRERPHLLYFVMKFIGGPSLDPILKDRGPLSIPMVQLILSQAGSALGYAHRRGVIHRDVKPANIMLDEDGWVVVTDFGIAKVNTATGLTMTGVTVGTPAYMSPEQCMGREVTGASDQYSLGVVAYQLITGQRPFNATSAMSMMYAHFNEVPRPLRELRPDCPPELEESVLRMLAKDAKDRWPSIDEAFGGVHADDTTRQSLAVLASGSTHATIAAAVSVPTSPVPPAKRGSSATVPTVPPHITPSSERITKETGPSRDTPVSSQGFDGSFDPTLSPRRTVPTPDLSSGRHRAWLLAAFTTVAVLIAVVLVRRPNRGAAEPQTALNPTGTDTIKATDTTTPIVAPPPADSARAVASSGNPAKPTTAATVTRVLPNPPRVNLEVGKSARIQLELQGADEARIPGQRQALWSSSVPATATVDQGGTIRAVAPGSAVVSATVDGVTGQIRVQVSVPAAAATRPESVVGVFVTPSTGSIPVGETLALTATPLRAGGGALTDRPIKWTSSGPAVAVSSTGVVTAAQPGVAIVRAESEGQVGSATITVSPIPVAEVRVSPGTDSVPLGKTVQLTVTARDARGATLADRRVIWESSDSSIASVAAGLVTAKRPGTVRITATVDDRPGTAQITVPPAPADLAAERGRALQEIDRSLDGFAKALNNRDVDQLKVSYPGMSAAEESRWRNLLGERSLVRFLASIDRQGEPKVEADGAELSFRLLLQSTYSGRPVRNDVVNYRAEFRREGSRWQLTRLQQQ